MLKIRAEQMHAFQAVADESFIARVAEHLRAEYADFEVQLPQGSYTVRQLLDPTLHAMIRHGIARARSYGLSSEASLIGFVALMIGAAPNFDAHPVLQWSLKNESIPPDERIKHLLDQASEQNLDAVKAEYDPTAWGEV
jgi:hypothetical protein